MFRNEINRFSWNLESLRDFVDLLDAYLEEQKTEVFRTHAPGPGPIILAAMKIGAFTKDKFPNLPTEEELKETLKNRLSLNVDVDVVEEDEKRSATIKISGEGEEKFDAALKALGKAQSRIKLLYNSSLMNLASTVELFFSELLHKYFDAHPEIVGTKEKIFSFEDLRAFESVADARQHYVNSKIEEILYSSFSDWVAFIRDKAKLSMSYLEADQNSLMETFQRRNLVVHNGSIVNSIYLSKVSTDLAKDISLGDRLEPDRNYLNDRIDLFERNCILIAAELWKKLAVNDTERSDVMIDITYRHLKGQRWTISEALSFFIMQDKQMPESHQQIGRLNYWLSKKRQGKWDKVSKEAASADFSAKSLRFQLALAALNERSDEFFSILPRVLQSEEISISELNGVPCIG